ncbi:MAG TPA: PAS domain-containing protein, partial [Sphingomonas sp.]
MERSGAGQSGLETLGSDRRFALLVDAIRDYAIYLLDTDGCVRSWNSGAQRFKGYLADEVIGRHFSLFYTEEDRASGLPETALDTARREGRFEAEGWRVRKDGSRFWTSVVIDAVFADDGELIGFAKITRDITERRAAQQELET